METWSPRPDPVNQRITISAIVLAAGRASRMGSLKQVARLGGEPLLAHILRTVRAAGIKDIVVVLGFGAEEIRKEIALDGIRVVENPGYEQGISSSIQMGLMKVPIKTSGVLVMLADQPLVQPSTLAKLIAEYRRSRSQATIPMHQGKLGNPVLLDRTLFGAASQLSGDQGFRSILRNLPGVSRVEVDDPGILLDIDTQEDLERCNQLYRERNSKA